MDGRTEGPGIGRAATARGALGNIGDVRLKGRLGERLDAMIERHVAAQDVDYITAPFLEKTERRDWWQTEFWGKWMHSAVPYLRYAAEAGSGIADGLRGRIERGIGRILASQEPCGYIGNYPDERRCGEGWDVWGMKYTMMGLLHYCDLVRTEPGGGAAADRALDACRRLCDYVIAEIGPGGRRGRELWETGNWTGYASSSILEPVVWLHRRTNEAKYLDFAAFIVDGMSRPERGPRLVDLALRGVSVADRNGYGGIEPDAGGGYVSKHNRWKSRGSWTTAKRRNRAGTRAEGVRFRPRRTSGGPWSSRRRTSRGRRPTSPAAARPRKPGSTARGSSTSRTSIRRRRA